MHPQTATRRAPSWWRKVPRRKRLGITSLIAWSRPIAATLLLVTNTGPRSEGYTYCTRCGLIEPTKGATGVVSGTHPKPYPDEREPDCQGSASTRGLALGTDFISDVLLVRLKVEAPLTLRAELLSTQVALRTIAEALTIAATVELDVDASELQAEYRPALTPAGNYGLEAEIYLYDTLAGGAGFTRRVHGYGLSIFNKALERLEACPANCDASCYGACEASGTASSTGCWTERSGRRSCGTCSTAR